LLFIVVCCLFYDGVGDLEIDRLLSCEGSSRGRGDYYTGEKLGRTHFRGSQPIYGVWATSGIEVVNACVMPLGCGTGDHRCFVVDFTQATMVGRSQVRVKKLKARRLNTNTKLSRAADKYNKLMEKNRIRYKVDEDHRTAYFAKTKEEAATALAASVRRRANSSWPMLRHTVKESSREGDERGPSTLLVVEITARLNSVSTVYVIKGST
jgi:hypothetical protein